MPWKEKVSTCFGDQDCVFAGHSSDIQNAQTVIAAAKAAGATFEDFEKEMVWHIYQKVKAQGMLQNHIATQVKTAKNLW